LELAPGGAVVGAGTVVGILNSTWESVAWVALGIVWVVLIAARDPDSGFATGFVVGTIGGLLAPILQALFLPLYLLNNPDVATSLAPLADGWPGGKAGFLLASGAVVAGAIGIVTGWTTAYLVRARKEREANRAKAGRRSRKPAPVRRP
jgi:hypothetical protein